MQLIELKKKLEMEVLYRITPTDIKIGVLNFSTGNIERYDFTVEYLYKIPYGVNFTLPKNQVVLVMGVVHYESGNSYNVRKKLSYTDNEELEKIGAALETAEYLDKKEVDYHSLTKKYI